VYLFFKNPPKYLARGFENVLLKKKQAGRMWRNIATSKEQ